MVEIVRRLTFRNVSTHRAVLYGFAALWIAVLHMEYVIPSKYLLRLPYLFQKFGACGVEMFVLLTGPGLYRSMQKDPNALNFYKKRLMRVFLPSAIVCAVFYGMFADSIVKWIAATLFFPYWLGAWTYWYVAFILTMYLLYPAIYVLQKKAPKALWGLLILSLIGSFIGSLVDNSWTDLCLRGVTRTPVFLLSCIIAPHAERNGEIPRWVMPSALAGSILFYLILRLCPVAHYFWRSIFYTLFSIFLILLLTRLCTYVRPKGITAFLYRCFAFCGGISLEIYLLYDLVCVFLFKLPPYIDGTISLLHAELLAFPITILSAVLLSALCRHLIREFTRIPIPSQHTDSHS